MTLALLGLLGIAVSTILGVLGIVDKKRDPGTGFTKLENIRLSLLVVAFVASASMFTFDYFQKQRGAIAAEQQNRRLLTSILRSLEPLDSMKLSGTISLIGGDPTVVSYLDRLRPMAERVNEALRTRNEKAYNMALPDSVSAEPLNTRDRRSSRKFSFKSLQIKPGPMHPALDRANEYLLANFTERGIVEAKIYCGPIEEDFKNPGYEMPTPDLELSFELNATKLEYDPSFELLSVSFSSLSGTTGGGTAQMQSVRDLHGAQIFIRPRNMLFEPLPRLAQAALSKFRLDVQRGITSAGIRITDIRTIELDGSEVFTGRLRMDGVKAVDEALYPCSQTASGHEPTQSAG
jgi:hypothetical protein